jgi:signal transduction histidine kinase
MPHHLTARLVLLLMLALLVITGLADYVRLRQERDRITAQTMTDQKVFAETLALAVRRNVSRGRTTEELQELLEDIRRRPGLIWAAIYDARGATVATSSGSGAAPAAGDALIRDVLERRAVISTPLVDAQGKALRYVRPVRWPDGGTGAVEVRQSLAAVDRAFSRAVRDSVVNRLVVLAAFVGCIVAVTRWSVARPIQALTRAARAVAGGDLAQRIAPTRSDELGQLAEEFNRMAESLERANRALVAQSEERLRLEREVQQAQKLGAVGLLAAEVAHELGTPLQVISGRAEALLRTSPPDGPGRHHLEVIQRQTERIASIVRDLLDYARPRRPTLRAEPLGPMLRRAADLIEGPCRVKRVRLRVDQPAAAVLADPEQLQQMLINLLGNALDAAPPGSVIHITEGSEPLLAAEGRHGVTRGQAEPPLVSVHVLDEGPGMTAEELDHAFQPFFSTKRRDHGTGLGLPIVEEIVRAHRGEVEILSAPGHGTEVIVRLPAAAEPAATPEAIPHAG